MGKKIISTFSERLKECLEKNPSFTATSLADEIGLSKQAISMYISGDRNPKRPTITVIAEVLNVDEAWLMGYDVPMERAILNNPHLGSCMKFYIKEARERVGLSQKDLAEKLNLKPTTFNGYETGAHDPKSNILAEIATALQTTTDYLLGLTSNPELPLSEHKYSVEYTDIASKYSKLDEHGKDIVDTVLEKEYTRSISIKEAAEDSDSKL